MDKVLATVIQLYKYGKSSTAHLDFLGYINSLRKETKIKSSEILRDSEKNVVSTYLLSNDPVFSLRYYYLPTYLN